MVAMMAGRELKTGARPAPQRGAVVLQARALRTGRFPAEAIDLTLHAGELTGIAGLVGAGRSELLRALAGIDQPLGGTIEVRGRAIHGRGPARRIAAGLVLVPEDRKQQGLVLDMSVRENLSLPSLRRRGFWLDRAWERQLAVRTIDEFAVSTPSPEQRVRNLSGGNQQKVVLGRWLACSPAVLLLDEPTRGIDVPSRQEIYARLRTLAAEGVAVLFASSEMEEVLSLADRVLVMREGRITGELAADQLGEGAVMALMTGRRTA
jgi:ribose transport system ATP-binding protein